MSQLYLTADRVGIQTGGGLVTSQEYSALQELGETRLVSRDQIGQTDLSPGTYTQGEPWIWDDVAKFMFGNTIKLAHCYAGTFSQSIRKLKDNGARITYTAAAHNIEKSKKAHEDLGLLFNLPHLTDPDLWKRYVEGYLLADVVICPSQHSAAIMRGYGCKRVEVIPHGCEIPETVAPLPKRFVVGYLGGVTPDKGLVYLLEAWKKLNYSDALLVIAGADSCSNLVKSMYLHRGGGNVHFAGWVPNVADFYNSISVYCQPSITEGFGIEVLEAMSYGRPIICSDGAGAVDTVPSNSYGHGAYKFRSGDVYELADRINDTKNFCDMAGRSIVCREQAKKYQWSLIREQYKSLWRSLLS